MFSDRYDKVLSRFANPIDSDDEDEHLHDESAETHRHDHFQHGYTSYELENALHNCTNLAVLGLSQDQKYEFKVAFEVVAGEGVKNMTKEQVFDLMLAMGYTFQPKDIEE